MDWGQQEEHLRGDYHYTWRKTRDLWRRICGAFSKFKFSLPSVPLAESPPRPPRLSSRPVPPVEEHASRSSALSSEATCSPSAPVS